MDTIKTEYNVLIKKHKLPSFDKLDAEFEIRALEENRSGRPVKAIIRVMAGKLRNFLEILDPVVSPNPNSIHSMIAVNNLSESIRKEMYNFYKKIGALYQECLFYDLEDEDKAAVFIKRLWKQWAKIKQTQKIYMKLIIETWSKELPKQKASYHG
jgi:hypothetical protein